VGDAAEEGGMMGSRGCARVSRGTRKYAEVSWEEGAGVLCLENFGFVYANPIEF
jgi:hypothetical protein